MKPFRLILAQLIARPLPPVISAHVSQRIYPHSAGWNDAYSFRARARTGSLFRGTTRDMHAHSFVIHGYFDWRVLAAARFLIRPGDTVVEVGANVGTETIGLADLVGRRGRVYAFEPVPSNAEQLQKAMSGAGLSQVEVVRAAVSDSAGTVTFFPPADERESGSGHLGMGDEQASGVGLQVECVTLDVFLADKPPVRLLVIDAEGAETRILRGVRERLQRDRPAVIVEAQDATLRRFGSSLADLHTALCEHDYQISELAGLGLKAARVADTRRTRNWLALPPNLAGESVRIHRYLLRCGLLPCVRFLNPMTRPAVDVSP